AHDDTRDVSELRRTKHFANFGDTRLNLFVLGLEHSLECVLNIFKCGVDDRVETNIHAFARRTFAGLRVGAHVEPNDDRVVDGREIDVALRDTTNTAVDDAQLHRIININLEE